MRVYVCIRRKDGTGSPAREKDSPSHSTKPPPGAGGAFPTLMWLQCLYALALPRAQFYRRYMSCDIAAVDPVVKIRKEGDEKRERYDQRGTIVSGVRYVQRRRQCLV